MVFRSVSRPLSSFVSRKWKMSGPRGAFIVFEGPDRSGKSTQSKLIFDTLSKSGISAEHIRFPDRSRPGTGKIINDYLQRKQSLNKQEAHLVFTQQRREEMEEMLRKLETGVTLICDRYSPSGIAYSVANGLSKNWCCEQEEGLIEPDLVAYLDIGVEGAAVRGGYGNERYENREFQEKVIASYRSLVGPYWKVFDATRPVEDITSEILTKVKETISQCAGKPIRHLWDSHSPYEKPRHGDGSSEQRQSEMPIQILASSGDSSSGDSSSDFMYSQVSDSSGSEPPSSEDFSTEDTCSGLSNSDRINPQSSLGTSAIVVI